MMRISFAIGICLPFIFCKQALGQGTIDSVSKPFICVPEIHAEFPGGIESLYRFIKKNLKFNSQDFTKGAGTKVFIRFVVNEDGSLTDFEVLKSSCEECNAKVIEVFKKMPRWIPSKINGKPVRQKMIFPVILEFE